MTTGPLDGIRVVELASLAPAPFGCMLLADLGAEVLRVERTGTEASVTAPTGGVDRGRKSIALDLKNAEGIAALKRIILDADVFVEGFRPGVAERLGIGPEVLRGLNPRLVYARMTGWGQTGPLAPRAGHDINYISVAGALEPIGRAGEAPHAPLNLIGDFAGGGTFMALGVLAALLERERSGEGQVVDAAMVDGASTLMAFTRTMHAAGQWEGPRGTNLLDGGASFYDTYETSDGKYISVGAIEPQFYDQLVRGLGLASVPLSEQMDHARWPEERERFRAAFRQKTRDEWVAVFDDTDACITPVLSPWEAHLHPHNIARESFIEVGGDIQPAPAPRFSRSTPPKPVPMDDGGRDPEATLRGWGLEPSEVAGMLESGVVS